MNGIIVVNKPPSFTSFDVVAKMRGICGTRKIGHGGTLDPMATGVLPVFIGNATKAVDLQPAQDKTYEATIKLGVCTDTGDITGNVLHQQALDFALNQNLLNDALKQFEGVQKQLPPMYSAVKINGTPLYKYARNGQTVERKERTITIHSISLLSIDSDSTFTIKAHCSKGTYIRTLAEDIGKYLNTPATLSALKRTQAGVFNIQQAHSLQTIQNSKNDDCLSTLLLPISSVFTGLPILQLNEKQKNQLLNGVKPLIQNVQAGTYSAWFSDAFMGIVTVNDEHILRGKKLFYER